MTTTTTTVSYEKETCGRCGGTGQYSYNQIDGTRCFGCGGTGKRLTKRGKAARAFADAMLEIPVQDVQIGQQVTFVDRMRGKRTRVTVREIEKFPAGSRKVGDEWVPMYAYNLIGETHKITGVGAGLRVRLTPTAEQIAEIAAYQDSLTQAGKPRKSR